MTRFQGRQATGMPIRCRSPKLSDFPTFNFLRQKSVEQLTLALETQQK